MYNKNNNFNFEHLIKNGFQFAFFLIRFLQIIIILHLLITTKSRFLFWARSRNDLDQRYQTRLQEIIQSLPDLNTKFKKKNNFSKFERISAKNVLISLKNWKNIFV